MDVKTKIGTTVSVDENHILNFPEGLFGFELYHNYAIFDSEYSPFMWMQSLEDSNLAFLIVDPFLISSEYEADIDDATLKYIGIESPEDLVVMTIVTIPSDGTAITANFLGPIVINRKNKKCVQVVLNDNRWTTKFDIVASLKKKGE